MEMDLILDEVRRDVFENPKPTIDLDYLYAVKNEIQKFADDTNSQLKRNVYQNYSLFIDSSREISTLKEEMRQLNILLEQQQTSMNKLLDQLNKTPIIQPSLERTEPRIDIFGDLNDLDATNDEQAEMLPEWFTKSPEDFDVLMAQRNLKEAVELTKKVNEHYEQFPKCCETQPDLKNKIQTRIQELIDMICSELQPVTERSVQGGPRSSVGSIQLLRELNLSSRAVKLYLDLRSSLLRLVLEQQKNETTPTLQFIKQLCSIFFHNIIETCKEFKEAFEVEKSISKAIEECGHLQFDNNKNAMKQGAANTPSQFNLIRPIYQSEHPVYENKSVALPNGNDISSQILSPHNVKVAEETLAASRSKSGYKTFYYLSTYSSLTYWITLEFENFANIFREHAFNNPKVSLSLIAESVYYLKQQCFRVADQCDLNVLQFIERELRNEIRLVIEDCGRKLVETIKQLDAEETWRPQQFDSNQDKAKFLEEMNEVDITTMPKYISDDFKLHFTASKTAFARCFLTIAKDLAKLVTPNNKNHVDSVLTKAFEIQMESVIEALSKAKMTSQARFIKGNSNFLLDKVIVVASERYKNVTQLKCQKLEDCRAKYQIKADSVAKLQKV